MMWVFGLIDSGEHHLWRETKRGGTPKVQGKEVSCLELLT